MRAVWIDIGGGFIIPPWFGYGGVGIGVGSGGTIGVRGKVGGGGGVGISAGPFVHLSYETASINPGYSQTVDGGVNTPIGSIGQSSDGNTTIGPGLAGNEGDGGGYTGGGSVTVTKSWSLQACLVDFSESITPTYGYGGGGDDGLPGSEG